VGVFIFMDMFQYISEIIKNISPQQRLWALIFTLITVAVITLGDNVIEAIQGSDITLENKIKRLETANIALNEQNRELQTIVIQSQIQCAKDITQVREDILKEIAILEKQMSQTTNPFELRALKMPPPTGGNGSDTVVMQMSAPQVIEVVPNNDAMSHLKKLKKQLKSDIENSK
jgi:hypothetical protein